MFRIRRVPDQTLPRDRDAIDKVCEIIRQQFPKIADAEIVKLPKFLSDPVKHGFRTQLYVAEDPPRCIRGFAILLHFPDLRFSYLDFLSAAPKVMGRGIGGALYERVREDALILGARGLYYECLPDDPALCPGAALLAENAARLKFYEAYGARPIIGTAYETPLKPDAVCPPYLVWDPLGRRTPLRRAEARPVVRAILERKYRGYCPPEYVEKVVASFRDDPVRVRPPKYARKEQVPSVILRRPRYIDQRIAVVVNDRHEIHHVRERGYIESPVRVGRILREIRRLDVFERAKARRFPEAPIRAVHDGAFVDYLKKACSGLEPGWSIYPYVFPVRNAARPPRDLAMRAGYYCLDTFTPLNRNAFLAAKGSVDCALTAARLIREGYRIAYALVRPPGHHAEKRAFGGFCYFNSAAIAANDLSAEGKVAILDLDYHHGNGTQEIFYERSDVLTISIHGHPRFAYPYFNGFPEERGLGEGSGFNLNLPLPETIDARRYRMALAKAIRRILRFRPRFLVLALGLDTAKGDPTGTWPLRPPDFGQNGRMIGSLRLPTAIVQEGGYRIRTLGVNARHFLIGLWEGMHGGRLTGASSLRAGESSRP